MSRLTVGMRIAVAETEVKYLERLHVYNNVPWNPKKMPQMIGKMGVVTEIDEELEQCCVRFYGWGHPDGEKKNDSKCQLNTMDITWSTRAVNPCKEAHFMTGDRAVLLKLSNLNKPQMVSVRITDATTKTYSLRTQQSKIFSWNQEENAEDVLLPIYAGRNLGSVMRDRSVVSTAAGDRSPRRVMHGSLPMFSGSELVEAVRKWSASGRHHEFQRVAQKNGDQINTMVGGRTPLMVAVELGNWNAVVTLIAMGGDREVADLNGNTLIHLAAKNGHVKIIEGLLMFISSEVNRVNSEGDTALHLSARGEHAGCVDRLLNAYTVQPNIQNQHGESVLHTVVALSEGETKQAMLGRLLANIRVNMHLPNNEDLTPLQLAIAKGMESTVYEILLAKPALLHNDGKQGLLPIHVAAIFGRNKVLEVILEMCNEVNKTTRTGRSALHFAVERWMGSADRDLDRLACVQTLVTAGASVSVVDTDGQTPLHLAVREIVRNRGELTDSKMKGLITMNKYNVKLDEIASRCRPNWQLAVACFLCLNGADLGARDRGGYTPYSIAPSNSVREVMAEFAGSKTKSYLPKSAFTVTEFDAAGVTMCTFNCDDNIADVQFVPCGHRVVCRQCIKTTPLRRCPLCYNIITSAYGIDGVAVELCSAPKPTVVEEESKKGESAEKADTTGHAEETMTEEARKTKEENDRRMQEELSLLRAQVEQFEITYHCAICLERKPDVAFNCGHIACQECSSVIVQCHICRQQIERRQTIYT